MHVEKYNTFYVRPTTDDSYELKRLTRLHKQILSNLRIAEAVNDRQGAMRMRASLHSVEHKLAFYEGAST